MMFGLDTDSMTGLAMAISVSGSALYCAYQAGKIRQTIDTHSKSIKTMALMVQAHHDTFKSQGIEVDYSNVPQVK